MVGLSFSKWFGMVALAAPLAAGPLQISILGNFGNPETGGSSIFNNQNYNINFLIPNTSLPSTALCCNPGGETLAEYLIPATLSVPGIDLTMTQVIQADFISYDPAVAPAMPFYQWLNFSFVAPPVGDVLVMTPLDLIGQNLWNGLAASAGTPLIFPENQAPSSARFFLEQSFSMGLIPLAVYDSGLSTFTATAVPEPASILLVAAGMCLIRAFRRRA